MYAECAVSCVYVVLFKLHGYVTVTDAGVLRQGLICARTRLM